MSPNINSKYAVQILRMVESGKDDYTNANANANANANNDSQFRVILGGMSCPISPTKAMEVLLSRRMDWEERLRYVDLMSGLSRQEILDIIGTIDYSVSLIAREISRKKKIEQYIARWVRRKEILEISGWKAVLMDDCVQYLSPDRSIVVSRISLKRMSDENFKSLISSKSHRVLVA